MTRHCHQCGCEWALPRTPGRSETCDRCGADWRVCLNCASYDPKVAYQCRDRRADPVSDKDRANYCEWFEMARRTFTPPAGEGTRTQAAREQFKKLFGD